MKSPSLRLAHSSATRSAPNCSSCRAPSASTIYAPPQTHWRVPQSFPHVESIR
jgi:hypothetical protein